MALQINVVPFFDFANCVLHNRKMNVRDFANCLLHNRKRDEEIHERNYRIY